MSRPLHLDAFLSDGTHVSVPDLRVEPRYSDHVVSVRGWGTTALVVDRDGNPLGWCPTPLVVWHAVTSPRGRVFQVYSGALDGEALEFARELTTKTRIPAYVRTVQGRCPRVGEVLQ